MCNVCDFLPPLACVLCFHISHEYGPCRGLELAVPEGMEPRVCGCDEYITEQQRGEKIVTIGP
jgi:hypothetical protein